MKKLLIIISLFVYIFGSSYLVHANMMGFSILSENSGISMEGCEQVQDNKDINSDCLDLCIGNYDKLNNIYIFDFKKLDRISINHSYMHYADVSDITEGEVCHLNKITLPDKIFPYIGYIGKITVLLI